MSRQFRLSAITPSSSTTIPYEPQHGLERRSIDVVARNRRAFPERMDAVSLQGFGRDADDMRPFPQRTLHEPLQTILALAADAVETRHTDQIEPSRSSEHPVGHIFRAIAQSELLDHRIHLRYLSQNFRIDHSQTVSSCHSVSSSANSRSSPVMRLR